MAAHQALPSLGFSRQEHWSGLPFPSPMHESEKWKWSRSVVSNPQRPHGLQPSGLPRPWDSPGKNTGVGCHFLLHCMKVKSESEVTQSCPTLSDPMDYSLPGSSVHGIFQARVLEWGAIAFQLTIHCVTFSLLKQLVWFLFPDWTLTDTYIWSFCKNLSSFILKDCALHISYSWCTIIWIGKYTDT